MSLLQRLGFVNKPVVALSEKDRRSYVWYFNHEESSSKTTGHLPGLLDTSSLVPTL